MSDCDHDWKALEYDQGAVLLVCSICNKQIIDMVPWDKDDCERMYNPPMF